MAKKRAFVKYTKQGRLIPGSLIVTTKGGYPVDGLYTEVPTNICCDTDIPGTITTSPKGWVRYTKKGAIVPGSLILGESHPKDGVWKEVTIDLCCLIEPITTTTTTSTSTTTTTTEPPLPIPIVNINGVNWTSINLDVTTYRNGDPIPEVTDQTEWDNLTTGAWCYYLNNTANGPTYGKLYNWYAVNDPRGIAPTGYHMPSYIEYLILINSLGGGGVAGGELKETGFTHWNSPNTGATNSSGFTALPGGNRQPFSPPHWSGLNSAAYFWTSTDVDPTNARLVILLENSASTITTIQNKAYGFSVRLIKD